MWRLLISITLVFVFSSCKDEKQQDIVDLNGIGRKVIVLNEGNFQSANSSISIYNPADNSVRQQVFQANNSGRPLGDVLHSMQKWGKNYYIVVNNSNKIEVVDATNFTTVGKIDGLNSPRYFLAISASKAYVSDLYDDNLYVVNPQTFKVSKKIPTLGWTEEMVVINNKLFVCQVDSNQVWVFDTTSDSLLAKINTNKQPQSMEVDGAGKLWVSCSGGINDGFPALHRINPVTFAVEKRLELQDVSKSIGEIELNVAMDKLLYLMGDLYVINISDTSLATSPLVPSTGRLFYSFGVDPLSDEIYMSDAIDYLQQGVIYRYDEYGKELSTFKAGIIPGGFYFD